MGFVLTGLIGYPVSHSRSPRIFQHWIKKYGCAGEYMAVEAQAAHLAGTVEYLHKEGYRGFNVTVPHKQAIMKYCDELDETARIIGAVNAVSIKENGMCYGFNTDAYGFSENLKEQASGFDFKQGPALVLGAGGAARAVVYALKKLGVPEVRITNRTLGRAEALAQDLGATVSPWDDVMERSAPDVTLLINATSLGMKGQPPLQLSLRNLPQAAFVYDLVYAPLETTLLKKAEENGNKRISGIGMLLHQARPAFEAWYGILPELDDELYALVMEE